MTRSTARRVLVDAKVPTRLSNKDPQSQVLFLNNGTVRVYVGDGQVSPAYGAPCEPLGTLILPADTEWWGIADPAGGAVAQVVNVVPGGLGATPSAVQIALQIAGQNITTTEQTTVLVNGVTFPIASPPPLAVAFAPPASSRRVSVILNYTNNQVTARAITVIVKGDQSGALYAQVPLIVPAGPITVAFRFWAVIEPSVDTTYKLTIVNGGNGDSVKVWVVGTVTGPSIETPPAVNGPRTASLQLVGVANGTFAVLTSVLVTALALVLVGPGAAVAQDNAGVTYLALLGPGTAAVSYPGGTSPGGALQQILLVMSGTAANTIAILSATGY